MKVLPLKLTAACLVALSLHAVAQTGENEVANPSAARAEVTLTPEQIDMLTKQLAELENQISKLRGDNLSGVLTKLRAAVTSDASAMAFFIECEKLVNIERKEMDRDQVKRMEERIDRGNDRRGVDEKTDGDPATAVRLQLQYLILCLEAQETEDRTTLIPKLQTYIKEVLASADKLKGRAFGQLAGDLSGGRNPVVNAYQLQPYLKAKEWTNNPADLRGMWIQSVLPWYRDNKPEELTAQWDQFVTATATVQKAMVSEAEYALWLQNDLPALRWERAEYLAQHGTTPVNALADMLKLIKEFPGHADAPKWLAALRGHLKSVKPGDAT